MDRLIRQIQEWWQNADKTTRIVSIVGTALFIAVVTLTLTLSSAPKMQPIASGADEAEKASVYDELNKKGFHPEISPQGDVTVPQKDYHRAQMELATAGKLPKAGSGGFGLDKLGAFDSPPVEQEKLLRAKESELSADIATTTGVASASVHIAPGKDSAVMDEKVAPTAVVSIMESSPGSVNKESGKAIAALIQGSVSDLAATGVKVITNSGHLLYDGSEQDGGGTGNTKLETESAESKKRTQQLQQELDTAFGRGSAIADVEVSYNMNPTTIVKHVVSPTDKPLSIEKQTEKLNGAGGSGLASGVAGAEANNPGNPGLAPVTTPGGESHKYDGQTTSSVFGATTSDTKEIKTPELIGETISVFVDKNKVKDINGLTKFVQGKLGDKQGETGYAANITATEFNTADADLAKKIGDDTAGQQRMQMLMGFLPVAALLVVGFLLSKSLPKLVPATTRALATNAGGALSDPFSGFMAGNQRQTQTIHQMPDYSALSGYVPAHQDPQIIEHRYTFDPITGAVVQGSASGQADGGPETQEEREARQTEEVLKALGIDDAGEEEVDIESIKQKINIPLERIKRMADKKPEMTAMLIKSWMMEDHR